MAPQGRGGGHCTTRYKTDSYTATEQLGRWTTSMTPFIMISIIPLHWQSVWTFPIRSPSAWSLDSAPSAVPVMRMTVQWISPCDKTFVIYNPGLGIFYHLYGTFPQRISFYGICPQRVSSLAYSPSLGWNFNLSSNTDTQKNARGLFLVFWGFVLLSTVRSVSTDMSTRKNRQPKHKHDKATGHKNRIMDTAEFTAGKRAGSRKLISSAGQPRLSTLMDLINNTCAWRCHLLEKLAALTLWVHYITITSQTKGVTELLKLTIQQTTNVSHGVLDLWEQYRLVLCVGCWTRLFPLGQIKGTLLYITSHSQTKGCNRTAKLTI